MEKPRGLAVPARHTLRRASKRTQAGVSAADPVTAAPKEPRTTHCTAQPAVSGGHQGSPPLQRHLWSLEMGSTCQHRPQENEKKGCPVHGFPMSRRITRARGPKKAPGKDLHQSS